MPEAVIVDAVRTPIGRAVKGSLKDVRADDLAAVPLQALVERNPEVDFAETVDIMMGCGFQAGEQGYNIGRNAGAAGRHRPPRPRHDRQPLLRLLAADDPHGLPRDQGRRGRPVHRRRRRGRLALRRRADFEFHPQLDGSEGAPYNVYIPMGMTAENVAERCNVTREAQDEWAAISQQRAVAARDCGHFDREIVPVHDARRHEVTQGRRPAPRHDGREARRAQAGVQARRHRHRRQRLPAQRRRRRGARDVRGAGARSSASSRARASSPPPSPALRPEIMGLGPIPAVQKVLEQAGMTIDDIDVARAQRGVRRPGRAVPRRVGHRPREAQPVRRRDRARPPVRDDRRAHHDDAAQRPRRRSTATIGLETMCVAGGMGQAMIVERLN